jgi:NAD(P)-dependent dehydrogenase (short-subunit alcohol dehydrogenase family)
MAESVNTAISDAIKHYSQPPSVVVNSAGITRDNFLLKMDEQWFQKVIDVNLKVGTVTAKSSIMVNVNLKLALPTTIL